MREHSHLFKLVWKLLATRAHVCVKSAPACVCAPQLFAPNIVLAIGYCLKNNKNNNCEAVVVNGWDGHQQRVGSRTCRSSSRLTIILCIIMYVGVRAFWFVRHSLNFNCYVFIPSSSSFLYFSNISCLCIYICTASTYIHAWLTIGVRRVRCLGELIYICSSTCVKNWNWLLANIFLALNKIYLPCLRG